MNEPQSPPNALTQSKKTEALDISAVIQKNRDEFTKALGNIPFDYFSRVAITCVRKNPILGMCTPKSLLGNLMDLAQIRLVPDSVLGEAYLVPFRNGKTGTYESTLMIGYKGFVKLVRRNTNVRNVIAQVVYSKDEFRCLYGSRRELVHQPYIKDSERGTWIGAYAYIAYGDSSEDFVFVPADYIARVEASSKGSDKEDSPWKMWPEQMWAKTALRQLLKTADIHPDVAVAMGADQSMAIDVESEVRTVPEPQPSALAAEAEAQMADTKALQAPAAEPVKLEWGTREKEPEAAAPKQRRAKTPQEAPKAEPPPQESFEAASKAPAPKPAPAAPSPEPQFKMEGNAASTQNRIMTAAELAEHNERILQRMRGGAPKPAPQPQEDPFPES